MPTDYERPLRDLTFDTDRIQKSLVELLLRLASP